MFLLANIQTVRNVSAIFKLHCRPSHHSFSAIDVSVQNIYIYQMSIIRVIAKEEELENRDKSTKILLKKEKD
jgi:hypothetical protein